MSRAALTLAALLLLPHPAPAASPHDGTWKGTYRTIRNDNSGSCDKLDNDNASVTVTDGKFNRTWGGNTFEVTVSPDGAVFGSGRRAQTTSVVRVIKFEGRIANGVMEGEYGHDKCAVRFSLRKA